MRNTCTNCGAETNEDVCPTGCKSSIDPTQPKPTTPWSQIPKTCWDCGAQLTLSPHEREYLGQCPDCTRKSRERTADLN